VQVSNRRDKTISHGNITIEKQFPSEIINEERADTAPRCGQKRHPRAGKLRSALTDSPLEIWHKPGMNEEAY